MNAEEENPATENESFPKPDRGERRRLLVIARRAIEEPGLVAADADAWRSAGVPIDGTLLLRPRGLFVTLHDADRELRGCIGTIRASAPLFETTARYAVAAAYEDPRFPPVEMGEIPLVEIHVSILLPDRPLADIEAIRRGIDGVSLHHPNGRALFLPEVMVETGWSSVELLDHLSRKAGLAPAAWRDPAARILAFETIAFGEDELREVQLGR